MLRNKTKVQHREYGAGVVGETVKEGAYYIVNFREHGLIKCKPSELKYNEYRKTTIDAEDLQALIKEVQREAEAFNETAQSGVYYVVDKLKRML